MRRSAQTTQGKWMWYLFTTHIHTHFVLESKHTRSQQRCNNNDRYVCLSVCRPPSIHGTARVGLIFHTWPCSVSNSEIRCKGIKKYFIYLIKNTILPYFCDDLHLYDVQCSHEPVQFNQHPHISALVIFYLAFNVRWSSLFLSGFHIKLCTYLESLVLVLHGPPIASSLM